MAEVHIQTKGFELGENILITGPTTGVLEYEATSIHTDDGAAESCSKDQIIGLNCDELVRRNDRVHVVRSIFDPQ